MRHINNSNWMTFVKDFGDALGGILIGYGAADKGIGYSVFGSFLVLLSIYLRFYNEKT